MKNGFQSFLTIFSSDRLTSKINLKIKFSWAEESSDISIETVTRTDGHCHTRTDRRTLWILKCSLSVMILRCEMRGVLKGKSNKFEIILLLWRVQFYLCVFSCTSFSKLISIFKSPKWATFIVWIMFKCVMHTENSADIRLHIVAVSIRTIKRENLDVF